MPFKAPTPLRRQICDNPLLSSGIFHPWRFARFDLAITPLQIRFIQKKVVITIFDNATKWLSIRTGATERGFIPRQSDPVTSHSPL
jgi:hypothetical protein